MGSVINDNFPHSSYIDMSSKSSKRKSKKQPNQEARLKAATWLSHHLTGFDGDLNGIFVCPTCMKKLSINNEISEISAGHIIPESAGGKTWTLVCKKCNSDFGRNQDKWFGEYLNILLNPRGIPAHAKTKSKYITVNGVTVAGLVRVSDQDGAIEVFTFKNLNPPGKVDSIPHGDTLTVEFTPEFIKHENEILVGYITSAYLLWFHSIGYNWVYQTTLEPVRKQIRSCQYNIGGAVVGEISGDDLHDPTIGVINVAGHAYACCVIYDRIVVFPPATGSKAPPFLEVYKESDLDAYSLNLQILNKPYSVNFDGGIFIFPDNLKKNPPIPDHMLFIPSDIKEGIRWFVVEK